VAIHRLRAANDLFAGLNLPVRSTLAIHLHALASHMFIAAAAASCDVDNLLLSALHRLEMGIEQHFVPSR